MLSERKPFVWEVELQKPDGKTITEKVHAHWSPDFDGVKESVSLAARCKATIRNQGNVQFQAIGEPKLLGRLGDEAVAA
jgi:hypothetical protein